MKFRAIMNGLLLRTILTGLKADKGQLTGLLGDLELSEKPRSLNACDRLYLPHIQKDFPDFDPVQAKALIRQQLAEYFADKKHFAVHNLAIARYIGGTLNKTIVYQAAVSWTDMGKTLQKRVEMNYAYRLPDGAGTVAANCPNCAGALGYGERECPYCGCRVAASLGENWMLTDIKEA